MPLLAAKVEEKQRELSTLLEGQVKDPRVAHIVTYCAKCNVHKSITKAFVLQAITEESGFRWVWDVDTVQNTMYSSSSSLISGEGRGGGGKSMWLAPNISLWSCRSFGVDFLSKWKWFLHFVLVHVTVM